MIYKARMPSATSFTVTVVVQAFLVIQDFIVCLHLFQGLPTESTLSLESRRAGVVRSETHAPRIPLGHSGNPQPGNQKKPPRHSPSDRLSESGHQHPENTPHDDIGGNRYKDGVLNTHHRYKDKSADKGAQDIAHGVGTIYISHASTDIFRLLVVNAAGQGKCRPHNALWE